MGQQGVGRQVHLGHRAAAQPLLGHHAQAGGAARGDTARRRTEQPHAPATRRPRVLARQQREQLLLAVAGDTGDADDLAGAHRQIDTAQRDAVRVAARLVHAGQLEHHRAGVRRTMLGRLEVGADHQPRQAGVVMLRRVDFGDHAPGAQHRAAVAQRAHLVELVADVQDAATAGGELAQRLEQPSDRLRRQHRSWFVEDQQPRLGQQRTDDLDALALADRQRVQRPPRIDVEAVVGGDALDARGDLRQWRAARLAEPDVLGNADALEQREMLKHHRDAELTRRVRVRHRHFDAVEQHATAVGLLGAVNDLHQRRLSRAVLAEHGVDRAGCDPQVDTVVGDDSGVTLADALQVETPGHDAVCRLLRRAQRAVNPILCLPPLTRGASASAVATLHRCG
ncbi:hypothetical protein GALL_370780 [mine drainage metagenome]|uniref:Uncharacterized protein n=1 Tax=mine drainage metagenome TaxID=410659 RepID=A0A1J5QZ23_9ZZZZ